MLKMVIPIEGYKKNSMHGFSRAESSGVFRGAAGDAPWREGIFHLHSSNNAKSVDSQQNR